MSKKIFCYSTFWTIVYFSIMNSRNKSTKETRRVDRRRILLAENSLISAVHFESLLQGWNFEIDIVQNGEEAIRKLKSTHYDILFLDIQLPEMGGLKVAGEIRLMGYTMLDFPILVLARHSVSRETLDINGVNEIILRPFSREELGGKIGQFVTK